eukprot:3618122-Lingulodinium_polyedra.AAC.1
MASKSASGQAFLLGGTPDGGNARRTRTLLAGQNARVAKIQQRALRLGNPLRGLGRPGRAAAAVGNTAIASA